MAKKIHFNMFKAPKYFDILLVYFLVIVFFFTLFIIDFSYENANAFLIRYIIIFLLLITIASIMEFKNKSEYINPFESIEIERFFRDFLFDNNRCNNFINKYNYKAKKQCKKVFRENKDYHLMSFRKNKDIYTIDFVEEKKGGDFFYFMKFLLRMNNHRIILKKDNDDFKIIRIE
jgi:hypothetical protein